MLHIPRFLIEPDTEGTVRFEAVLPESSQGYEFTTIITLHNSAGSTRSEAKQDGNTIPVINTCTQL